ncbi:MAG: hypothetical protein FWD86_03060, partial [Firmicutes bacterium]|nr:hypothetical protein [Bacillota bacterium]
KVVCPFLIGAGVMFAVFFASGARFSVEVMSIGMGMGWILSSVLNILAIKKKAGFKWGFLVTMGLSAALAVPTVFLTKWLYDLLNFVPEFFRIGIGGGVGVVFLVALNVVFGNLKLEQIFSKTAKKEKASKIRAKNKISQLMGLWI